ncbi:MAG: M48 family metallopeptidase [Acidobacteria bacterium]|nr:M48 family metallopeptidase [Acidobacteriota bacterium]
MKRITILLLLAALCCAASDKTPNRKVGGGLNFFSVEEESAMGRRYSAEMNRKLDLIEDPRIAGYVTRLGRRLAADSRAPGVEYRFFVVNTREVNAFAMPGGFIYVNRGLIELAATESELAGVIGHEIGHVVGRHSTKQMSKQLLLAGIVMATTAAVGTRSQRWAQVVGTLGGVGVFFAAMKHSRNDERQSDWLGLENMNRSGYDPRGLMTFFEKLDQTAKGKGGGTGLAFLSSHPVPAERVRNMESEIALLGSTANAAAVDPAGFAACREQLRAIPLPAGGKDKTLGSALAQLDPAENRSGPAEPRPANDDHCGSREFGVGGYRHRRGAGAVRAGVGRRPGVLEEEQRGELRPGGGSGHGRQGLAEAGHRRQHGGADW